MTTPRKLNPKRTGRPRKVKPPKAPPKKVGRKRIANIRGDHDRHAIALTDALLRRGIASSENAACDAVASLRIGIEIDQGEPSVDGLVRTSWRKRTGPGIANSFEGYSATLRGKRQKYRDQVSWQWRQAMMRAFMLTWTASDKGIEASVLALACSAGEREFAETVLFKMIDARVNNLNGATCIIPGLSAPISHQ